MSTPEAVATDTIWCAIPVFNNGETVRDVALRCRAQISHVIVVDDGSIDVNVETLLAGTGVTVLKHATNLGKGKAILTALEYVALRDGRYLITVDGDGQHQPEDIKQFIPLLEENENTLVVGCRDFTHSSVPKSSRIGREIANFWLRVEAGVSVNDCQSGFRAYPVKLFHAMKLNGAHYDFETEALARAAWAGLTIKTLPIRVWYPAEGKRVSHFKPWLDNARISWMHARLVLRRLLPLPHKKLVNDGKKMSLNFLRHPIASIKYLLKESATPSELAASAGVGILLAALPLLFVHTITILYVTARLHMNKIMAVSIQNLCNPPFVPFLCIELGHFMREGVWLTSVSKEAFLGQVPSLLWDWLLGSLVIGPVLALFVGVSVFFIAKTVQTKGKPQGISAVAEITS